MVPALTRSALLAGLAIAAAADTAARQATPTGTISGVVRDETGDPIAGAAVTLMRFQIDGLVRRLVAIPEQRATTGTTTDRTNLDGSYKLTNVPPGDYVVSAAANRDQVIANDQKTVKGPATVRVPMYFPGSPTPAGAAIIMLRPGETRSEVNISLVQVPAASVEGVIRNPVGPLQGLVVGLQPIEGGPGLADHPWSDVGGNGRFRFLGVPPGDYIVKAMVTESPRPNAGQTPRPVPQMWGEANVTVSGVNVRDVAVTLEPAMAFEGQIVIEGTNPPPDQVTFSITLNPYDRSALSLSRGAIVRADRFSIVGLTPGTYGLSGLAVSEFRPGSAGPPSTWRLASAVVSGRDLLDFPLEILPGQNIRDAALTFTDKTQEVSGVLLNGRGAAVVGHTILVFSTDRAYWHRNSRRTRTTQTGSGGTFVVSGLPAGDYFIAALTDIGPDDTADATRLESIAAVAVELHLEPGEKKVQHFRIGPVR